MTPVRATGALYPGLTRRFVVGAVGLALAFALACGRTITQPCDGKFRADTLFAQDGSIVAITMVCR